MNASEYNIQYFKCIRDEITKRIQLHYQLVTGKVAVVGGILAYLAKSGTNPNLDPFLTCSILGFSIDVAVLENLGWIRSAGAYVRRNIETGHPRLINWERDFAQRGGHWACFHPMGYRCGVWSIAALLFSIGFIQVCVHGPGLVDVALSLVGFSAGIYTWKLVDVNLGGEGPPMQSKKSKEGDESPIFLPEEMLKSKGVEFKTLKSASATSPPPPGRSSPPDT